MNEFFSNTLFLEIALSVLGLAYLGFKSTDFVKKLMEGRRGKAIEAVGAAVVRVSQEYVDDLKKARVDGKLTPEEAKEARERAKAKAVEIGKTQGVDLLKVLGEDLIYYFIEKKVSEVKRG
jgi:cysteine synthase